MANERTSIVAVADVDVSTVFQFGGQSGKKRKFAVVQITDSAATATGWIFGGTAGDILNSVLGFVQIDAVVACRTFTTSTGATTHIHSAAPSLPSAVPDSSNTQCVLLTNTDATLGAPGDITLAVTETLELVVIGY